jgi:hypothetical protein
MSGLATCTGCGRARVASGSLCTTCIRASRKTPRRERDDADRPERGRTDRGLYIPPPPRTEDMAAFRRR